MSLNLLVIKTANPDKLVEFYKVLGLLITTSDYGPDDTVLQKILSKEFRTL